MANIYDIKTSAYYDGGLYDSTSGSTYTPPPPPTPLDNILLESGFRILLENGDYLALET